MNAVINLARAIADLFTTVPDFVTTAQLTAALGVERADHQTMAHIREWMRLQGWRPTVQRVDGIHVRGYAKPAEPSDAVPRRWYVGSMNDGCFIIDQPPRPSHDNPDHDADVNCITGFPSNDEATFAAAQRICDAHNAALSQTMQPQGAPSRSRVLPITAAIMVDDGGERPAYCLMAAYAFERDANTAMQLLAAPGAAMAAREQKPIDLGLHCPECNGTTDGARLKWLIDALSCEALIEVGIFPFVMSSDSDWRVLVDDAKQAHAKRSQDGTRTTMTSKALKAVISERLRQQSDEGWTPEHDDGHVNDEIAAMAAYYAMPVGARDWPASETGYGATFGEAIRPEGWQAKESDRWDELVKAAALVLAELERLERADAVSTGGAA